MPERGLTQLLERAARTRRTRRWLALAAAAAAVAIAAGSGVAAGGGFAADRLGRPVVPGVSSNRVGPGSSDDTGWKAVSARSDLTRATATVMFASRSWGTELEVRVSGIAPGTACQLWVNGAGAQKQIVGGWIFVPGEAGTWIQASTSLSAASLRSFAVTAGRRVLITVPVNSR
jgi:hypothetical protein